MTKTIRNGGKDRMLVLRSHSEVIQHGYIIHLGISSLEHLRIYKDKCFSGLGSRVWKTEALKPAKSA